MVKGQRDGVRVELRDEGAQERGGRREGGRATQSIRLKLARLRSAANKEDNALHGANMVRVA